MNLDRPGQHKEVKVDQLPLVVELALCDNHGDFDSQSIKQSKRCLRFNPFQSPPPNSPTPLLPASPAMQDSGSRWVNSPTVEIQPHKHWELWMSENNLQLSITRKWLVGLFHAMVKIVCSPNSLEALKEGVGGGRGFNAEFVPLSLLGSFALQKQWGKYFLINRDLKRKPQERNSQCCASKIQEEGKWKCA